MQRFALEARKIAEELRREPLASAQSTVWRGAVQMKSSRYQVYWWTGILKQRKT